jgi:hypothetical protein
MNGKDNAAKAANQQQQAAFPCRCTHKTKPYNAQFIAGLLTHNCLWA